MRLREFYDPEQDRYSQRQEEDTRKPVLTLEQLNKLRKYRDIKRAEEAEHDEFVSMMYGAPAE